MPNTKEWAEANLDKIRLYHKRHYIKHREEILAKNKVQKYVHREENRAYARKWSVENRKRVRACTRNRMNKLNVKHDELLATQWCIYCGENDIRCLDWHHRNPHEKKLSVCVAIMRTWSWEKIMAEIEKCDCVCANCHRICNYKEINSGNVGRIWGAWAIKQTPVAEAEVRK